MPFSSRVRERAMCGRSPSRTERLTRTSGDAAQPAVGRGGLDASRVLEGITVGSFASGSLSAGSECSQGRTLPAGACLARSAVARPVRGYSTSGTRQSPVQALHRMRFRGPDGSYLVRVTECPCSVASLEAEVPCKCERSAREWGGKSRRLDGLDRTLACCGAFPGHSCEKSTRRVCETPREPAGSASPARELSHGGWSRSQERVALTLVEHGYAPGTLDMRHAPRVHRWRSAGVDTSRTPCGELTASLPPDSSRPSTRRPRWSLSRLARTSERRGGSRGLAQPVTSARARPATSSPHRTSHRDRSGGDDRHGLKGRRQFSSRAHSFRDVQKRSDGRSDSSQSPATAVRERSLLCSVQVRPRAEESA
jgi:hypothetical protein